MYKGVLCVKSKLYADLVDTELLRLSTVKFSHFILKHYIINLN